MPAFAPIQLLAWQLGAPILLLAAAGARRTGRSAVAAALVLGLLPLGFHAARVAARPAPLLALADQPGGLAGPWRLIGRLVREPEPTDTGSRLLLDVSRVRRASRSGRPVWVDRAGRVEITVAGGPGPAATQRTLLPGARVEAFLSLRRDRPPANPGLPRHDRLKPRGVDLRASLKSPVQLRVLAPASPGGRALAAVRARLRAAIDAIYAPRHRPLVAALLLGERARVPDRTTVTMAGAGLAHLLSISGLHVGLIAASAIGAARLAGASPRLAAALGVAAAVALALVVAPRPPVQRAAIMAGALLGGRALDRRGTASESLAMAVGLLVWHWPPILHDAGFQLSAGATAGLVALAPGTAAGAAGRLAGWVGAPVAAQAAIAPLLAARAGSVPIAGLLLNPLAVPLLGLLLPGLLAAVFLQAAGATALAAPLAGLGARGLDTMVALAADGYPRAVLALPGLGVASVLLWWTGLGWLAWATRYRLAGILLLAGAAVHAAGPTDRGPRLVALDVGQGDALVLQAPEGAVLVDGGGYSGIDWDIGAHLVVPALRALGVRRLDVVALSHPHADHAGGLPAVIDALPTAELWLGATPPGQPLVEQLLQAAARRGTRALVPTAPANRAGCSWRVMLPPPGILRRAVRRVDNEGSLVVATRCGGRGLLLTGDAGTEVEAAWLPRLTPGAGMILKVGHHGSRTATDAATLASLRPRIALVSVGSRNPFGLPRDEVLDRLRGAGVALYRTDRDGALTVTLGGRNTVRGERWAQGTGARHR